MANISTIIKALCNRRSHLLVALVSAGLLGANAQENLRQEITVTHHEEVKPTDAVRLNVSPTVSMPALASQKLDYSMRQIRVGVPATLSTLSPASYADSIYRSPYRGYAAAGYLPMLNLGAAAGYKFIDNDRVRLNGWMQYDGTSYRGDLADFARVSRGESMRVRRNTVTVGGALHSAVGRQSFLDFGIDYTFARFNTPSLEGSENQNVHRLNLQGLWTMDTGKWDTGIGIDYGHFAYGNTVTFHESPFVPAPAAPRTLRPARENKVSLLAFASGKIWGAEAAGMEVKASYLNYGNHAEAVETRSGRSLEPMGSFSHALISLRPYYRTTWMNVNFDLGMNIDFTINNGKAFHISPAAQATWKPSGFVTVYIKANGGEHQNTLGSLYNATYYTIPNMAYGNSHLPLDGEVGVTVGLFKGFYSEISAGYAIANDWLMPVALWDNVSSFEKVNMKGYKIHLGLGYRYRDLVEVSLTGEMAPRKYDRGYYLWRDRARYVADATLRVTPIEPLDVSLSWNYRGSRCQVDYTGAPHSLGNINSLGLGAVYRLTPQWSIFGKAENLLNHRYNLIGGVPAEGIRGLVGATYKF